MTDEPLSAYAKGVLGETAACAFLCDRGMQLLQTRFKCPYGEIDLILLDGETLVFAEVKTRERGTALQGQLAVTPRKRQRLVESARRYLSLHPEHAARLMRFDVVVVCPEGIEHLPDAFQGSEW